MINSGAGLWTAAAGAAPGSLSSRTCVLGRLATALSALIAISACGTSDSNGEPTAQASAPLPTQTAPPLPTFDPPLRFDPANPLPVQTALLASAAAPSDGSTVALNSTTTVLTEDSVYTIDWRGLRRFDVAVRQGRRGRSRPARSERGHWDWDGDRAIRERPCGRLRRHCPVCRPTLRS